MTDGNDDTTSSDVQSDDDLGQLLAAAGRRRIPTTGSVERAYTQLKGEWQDHVKQIRQHKIHRRNKLLLATASIAATAVVALIGVFSLPVSQSEEWALQVAAGTVSLDLNSFTAPSDTTIQVDHEFVATTAVRIETAAGTDLRLAENTRGRWIDANTIFLLQGRVYVDTRDMSNFAIFTTQGEVRDIGTRYMADLSRGKLDVAVREGIATVESDHGTYTAAATEHATALLHIDRNGVTESNEPKSDSRWEWIHSVSSGYLTDSLPVVLSEIGRDLGKTVVYGSRGVEATVANDTVQGVLDALRPRQALDLVTRSADLAWVEDSDTITINFNR